ncbi:MAG: crossover junction endodeoxyribonuclease RuvC [Dehalococcoidia bacterium]
MRVLGIDPGTIAMGYGLVEGSEPPTLLDCGVLTAPRRTAPPGRLAHLYEELEAVIDRLHPQEVAIEEPFTAKNPRSALAVGQAQGIAILAAARRGLPVYQYSPAQVKQSVTNYGSSSKEQVQEMVRIILRLPHPPRPSDAADALAVALCHLQKSQLDRLLGEVKK